MDYALKIKAGQVWIDLGEFEGMLGLLSFLDQAVKKGGIATEAPPIPECVVQARAWVVLNGVHPDWPVYIREKSTWYESNPQFDSLVVCDGAPDRRPSPN